MDETSVRNSYSGPQRAEAYLSRMMDTMNCLRFLTDTGIKAAAVTASQMREVDRIANEETGPNLFQ